MIYFDNAATTPMSAKALDTYTTVAQNFYANSESLHEAGNAAGQLVQEAQTTIANLFKIPVEGIIFTSGGTEANQLGIRSLATGSGKTQILVSPLEHSSVYQALDLLHREFGFDIQTLPVTATGQITAAELTHQITANTALIVIQAVNSITGIQQNLPELKQAAQTAKVPLFVDAVQAMGKIDFDPTGLAGFSASAHKFNGPKSSGLLYLSPQVLTDPPYRHVFQQNGFLPGTLDVPGIVSMTTALTDSLPLISQRLALVTQLKAAFLKELAPSFAPVIPTGGYPGICGVILPKNQGQDVVTRLGQQGICFSTVSACSIKDPRPDKTLTALGYDQATIERYIRLSFGPENTLAEVDKLATILNHEYA
ncbi:MAG: cysteine desulfurase [Lactobacillus sp.]|jgi:cysteine desulfurase|nr:cysteine desulfurase [Lactobacillus sp.]